MNRATLTRQAITSRTWAIAALVVLVGVLLLLATNSFDNWMAKHTATKTSAEQLAGLIITTGALAILWDLRGKRDVIDEVMTQVRLGTDVNAAGLQRATMDWRAVPWTNLFAQSRSIDVFISYGSTWLSNNSGELKTFASDPQNKMRYVLPDPSDDVTMKVLAQRYDYTPEMLQSKIRESASSIAKLSTTGAADIRVYFRTGAPTFTCYRFDDQIVVTLYSHGLGRGAIPTFIIGPGTFFEFFSEDLEAIHAQSSEVPLNELGGTTDGE